MSLLFFVVVSAFLPNCHRVLAFLMNCDMFEEPSRVRSVDSKACRLWLMVWGLGFRDHERLHSAYRTVTACNLKEQNTHAL